MKKLIVIVLSCSLFLTSCSTIPNISSGKKQFLAFELGRAITITYIYRKDKVSPEHQKYVMKIWESFNKVMNDYSGKDINQIKSLIALQLKEKIKNKKVYDKVIFLLNGYFNQLNNRFDFDNYNIEETNKILQSFRHGIISAWKDFN